METVDVAPLAAAAERAHAQGFSWHEMAKQMGYTYERGDTSTLKRRLGLSAISSHGMKTHSRSVQQSTAMKLCKVLDLDPVDVGI